MRVFVLWRDIRRAFYRVSEWRCYCVDISHLIAAERSGQREQRRCERGRAGKTRDGGFSPCCIDAFKRV